LSYGFGKAVSYKTRVPCGVIVGTSPRVTAQ
jgi:hypothetical protein